MASLSFRGAEQKIWGPLTLLERGCVRCGPSVHESHQSWGCPEPGRAVRTWPERGGLEQTSRGQSGRTVPSQHKGGLFFCDL